MNLWSTYFIMVEHSRHCTDSGKCGQHLLPISFLSPPSSHQYWGHWYMYIHIPCSIRHVVTRGGLKRSWRLSREIVALVHIRIREK